MNSFPKLNLFLGLLLSLEIVSVRAQSLVIRTFAGAAQEGATNGFGSNARFRQPQGLAVDGLGNVFVADSGNGAISKINPLGFASVWAGVAGAFGNANGSGANARFFGLQGIATDPTNTLFVTDSANGTLRRVTPDGAVAAFAGGVGDFNSYDGAGSNARFYQPQGIALDAAGRIYVADSWNHTIRRISPASFVTTLAGLAGNPGSVDGTNSKARFNRPTGIAVDGATNLYVTDSLNHAIRKITPAGQVSTIAGLAGVWGSADGTNNAARFYQPEGILALDSSTFLIADTGNHVIRKLSAVGPNWVVTTVAGAAGAAGSVNGSGNAARFQFPTALARDAAGYLYIVDSGNNMIRTTRVVAPTLQTGVVGTQAAIMWPISSEGFLLEFRPDIAAAWSPVTNQIPGIGDNFVFTPPPDQPSAFYRLRRP